MAKFRLGSHKTRIAFHAHHLHHARRKRFKRRSKTNSISTRRRLLTCLFLPIWLLTVINIHSTIAVYREKVVEFPTIVKRQDKQELKRTFYVEPDENNNIAGRVEIEGGKLNENSELEVLLLQNGDKVKETRTSTGEFQFKDFTTQQTGQTYTLIAKGTNGFLAYALHVRAKLGVPERNKEQNTLMGPASQAQYVSLVDPQDQNRIVDNNLEAPSVPADTFKKDFQIDAAAIPPTFKELERIINNQHSFVSGIEGVGYARDPKQEGLKISGGFEFNLDEDGNFTGQVIVPSDEETPRDLSELNVFLIQNDSEYAQDDVENNGDFQFRNVAPGVYGLIASGKDGFAAVSIRLIGGKEKAKDKVGLKDADKQANYVTVHNESLPAINLLTIPLITNPSDVKYVRNAIQGLNIQQLANIQGGAVDGQLGDGQNGDGQISDGQISDGQNGDSQNGDSQFVEGPIEYRVAPASSSSPGFGPSVNGGGVNGGGITGGGVPFSPLGRGGFLRRAAVIGGIVALAVSGSDDETVVSPNDL